MNTLRFKQPRPETASVLAWLVAGVLGLNLLTFAYTALTMERSQQDVERSTEQWTQNLALALEKEVAGTLKTSDMVLLSVIDEFNRQQAAGIVDAAELNAHIEPLRKRFPYIDGARLTDASGILRHGSDVKPDQKIDLSDREHFKALRDLHEDALVVSRPQKSRANNKWVVVLARRINELDGRFAGMAFVPIPVDSLTRTFSQIDLPPGGSITLRALDLSIVARYPIPAESDAVGQAKVSRAFTDLLATGATYGTFRAVTPLDGVSRLLSFRKVGEYPLYLVVGRAENEYLGEWRNFRRLALVATLSFLLLTALLSLMVFWYWKRLARARDAMEHMAHTDFLTRLANRRAFIGAVKEELARARRYATPVSVLMLDIDNFKSINDKFGHEAGDTALQELARLSLSELRAVDLMGRWGGEEFVVLLPETDAASAAEAAERLRAAIEKSELPGAGGLPVLKMTVSIGYAEMAQGDEDIDTLMRRADDALYEAKNSGRNRVRGSGTPVS